jgi:hypothetical protein
VIMTLTQAEIARYAPYHTMPEFKLGFDAYTVAGRGAHLDPNTVGAQAYDRGAECAMRRSMQKLRDENYVKKSEEF